MASPVNWAEHPDIKAAARAIADGGVVAYPTEAVWGLGCDPDNAEAVRQLLSIKQRPQEKGLILVAASMDQLEPYISHLDQAQRRVLEQSWPGPITWVIPNADRASPLVRGDHSGVAVRVSAHPLVLGLCQAFGGPIVSTSANRSGDPPARDAATVRRYFPDQLAAITPGEVGDAARPSEIRDLLTGIVLRDR